MEKHDLNREKTIWTSVGTISLKLLPSDGSIQGKVPRRDQAKEVGAQKEAIKGSRIRSDSEEEKKNSKRKSLDQ